MEPILIAQNVTKNYHSRTLGGGQPVMALAGVSLAIHLGDTFALVGPSGCGKSTLALCLAGLERVSSGNIWLAGTEIGALNEKGLRAVRPSVQMVFQDPASSLNGRLSALELVSEPLNIQRRFDKAERYRRAGDLLVRVGIRREKWDQRPDEFSGGQKQRIALARALILEPKIVILDEVLSGLDCSVQAQVVNLLLELQSALRFTYLFITHDLAMAAHVAKEIAVMDAGRIVEKGVTARIVREPQDAATRRLLAAAGVTKDVALAPLEQ